MKEAVLCQSCGMPMASAEYFGTNYDSTPSGEYCCFCYERGSFRSDLSFEEKIAENLSYHDVSEKKEGRTVTMNEMEVRMRVLLPTLKRWKSHNLTHQQYYASVNRALNYINEHLSYPIFLSELASEACLSEFHFHRIFKSVIGEGPGEYIQRLRLEKSAFMLQTTKMTISDIAEKTGYQSPHALSKAFRKKFGISPGVYRKYPTDLNVDIENTPILDSVPQIRNVSSKQAVCLAIHQPFKKKDAFTEAWRLLVEYTGACGDPARDGLEYITLSRDNSIITGTDKYRIYACICGLDKIKARGKFGIQTIEGGTYAVFRHKGPYSDLNKLYCHIYRYWLPNSEYVPRDMAAFEKYLNTPDKIALPDLVTEIYIPIEKAR